MLLTLSENNATINSIIRSLKRGVHVLDTRRVKELDAMSRKELVAVATEMGLSISTQASSGSFILAILNAEFRRDNPEAAANLADWLGVSRPPTQVSGCNKSWTPRKWLVVAASGTINRERLEQAGRHGIQAYNRHAYECVEATIADWEQKGIYQNARDYFHKSSDKAIHRLIRDVLKEARAI